MLQDPWKTREQDFWLAEDPEARLRFLINYAVLAPSTLNTQPWLFSVNRNGIHLYADRRRGLAVSDPEDRQLTISCGAALYYLGVAMRRFGREPVIHTFPSLEEPDLMASVSWGDTLEPTAADIRAFEAIRHRRAQHAEVSSAIPQAGLLSDLTSRFDSTGATMVPVVGAEERRALADLVYGAMSEQAADGRFRREQASWMHPDRKRSRDGFPGRTGNRSAARRGTEPSAADFVHDLVEGGAAMLLLATANDSHASWLETGRSLARLLLSVAGAGLAAQFLNQPLEIPEYRRQVNQLLDGGLKAQVVLRVGVAKSSRAAPRRPVNEVLLNVF